MRILVHVRVYAATKAALRSLTRTWASDLKGRDIRVNIVMPCAVVTPAYKSELKLTDTQIELFTAQMAGRRRQDAGLIATLRGRP